MCHILAEDNPSRPPNNEKVIVVKMPSMGKENSANSDNDLFAGRGAPALMSTKEPAIRMLKERYSESFAVTQGARKGQVHLFLIKLGMWALVWTFTAKDVSAKSSSSVEVKFDIQDALKAIESGLSGGNVDYQQKLDHAVSKALQRIRSKINGVDSISHKFN